MKALIIAILTLIPVDTSFIVPKTAIRFGPLENSSNFSTKRIISTHIQATKNWVSDESQLFIVTKDSFFSSGEARNKMSVYQSYNGRNYYYYDIPVRSEAFKIEVWNVDVSVKSGETTWCYDIYPSKLYKIRDPNKQIMFGVCDTVPDVGVMSLLLGSYLTFSDSYDNGFSAYQEIQNNFLSKWKDGYNGQYLSTSYIYDYTREEYELNDPSLKKTHEVSLEQKISELKGQYDSNAHKSASHPTSVIFTAIFLALIILCTAGTSVIIWIFQKRKNDKG
jgi:hypothetical protein